MINFIGIFLLVIASLIIIRYAVIFTYKFSRNPPEKLDWIIYDELIIASCVAYIITYFII